MSKQIQDVHERQRLKAAYLCYEGEYKNEPFDFAKFQDYTLSERMLDRDDLDELRHWTSEEQLQLFSEFRAESLLA